VCYESTTGRTGYEEFEAHHGNYKDQWSDVFRVEKQLPTVNKDIAVKAGERLAFFFGWFDFFGLFVIFGRDYEKPAAGCASSALSGVLIGKSDYLIAIGAKKLDCHLIVLRIVYIVLRFLFGTLLIYSSAHLVPLHAVSEALEVVGPFFSFQQVNLVLFYEHSEMLFQRHHFFVGPVSSSRLQL
jgi:hypothetical protein